MRFRDLRSVDPGPVCPTEPLGPRPIGCEPVGSGPWIPDAILSRFFTVAILTLNLTKCELSRDDASVCHALHRCHELWNRTGFNPVKLPAFHFRLSIFKKGWNVPATCSKCIADQSINFPVACWTWLIVKFSTRWKTHGTGGLQLVMPFIEDYDNAHSIPSNLKRLN